MSDASRQIKADFKKGQMFSLLLILAASLFGLLLIVQLLREETSLVRAHYQREEILQSIMEGMLNKVTGLRAYADSMDDSSLGNYRKGQQEYATALQNASVLLKQPRQAEYSQVLDPLKARADAWQDFAGAGLLKVQSHDLDGNTPRSLLVNSKLFDAFRDAFHDARVLNEKQILAQDETLQHGWIEEGLFALAVMGIGIGAAVSVGQRAATTLGDQAAQLLEQTQRVRQHQQELSAQNTLLQTQQEQLRTRNRELQLLEHITAIVASHPSAETILTTCREPLAELISFDRCGIMLQEDEETVRVQSALGREISGWEPGSAHALEATLAPSLFVEEQPRVLADITQSEASKTVQAQVFAQAGLRACALIPLVARGSVIGSLNFFSQQPNRYDDQAVNLMLQVARSLGSALENVRLHEEERAKSELLTLSIQETHHRVKNNLQAISALLDVQLMDADESIPREVLTRTINQIKAIALVHDLLSHGNKAESVDAKKVLEKLLPLVTQSYQDVDLEVSLDPLSLPMRQATSLALIVNELTLNSFKHCGGKRCQIRVTGKYKPLEKSATLVVQDNGPGFPPDFHPDKNANIGMQLITTLVRSDLRGTILFETENGARVTLQFPVTPTPQADAWHKLEQRREP